MLSSRIQMGEGSVRQPYIEMYLRMWQGRSGKCSSDAQYRKCMSCRVACVVPYDYWLTKVRQSRQIHVLACFSDEQPTDL